MSIWAPESSRRALRLCGALLLFFTLPIHLMANDKAEEEKKLNALKSKIAELQQALKTQSQALSEQQQSLERTERASGEIRKQIALTEKQIDSLNVDLQNLAKQQTQLRQDKQAQQKLIGQHISAAYRLGNEQQVKLLLNEESPAEFNRLMRYHDYFVQARKGKVTEYLKTIDSLNTVEASINQKKSQRITERDNLSTQQDQLKLQVAQRKSALAEVAKQITSDQQKLNKLVAERKALKQVIQSLEQALADLTPPASAKPFSQRKGKMVWPTKGRLTKRFGTRRRADITWDGLLISAQAGTEVTAVHTGRVVFSDYLRGQGLLLIIDHSDGYLSLYAHNQVLLKETGDWVQAGEAIGKVGDSGGLGENALYFEIRKNGKPINPARWLRRR